MLTIQTSKATVLAVRLPKGAEVKNCIKYEDIDFLFYQMPIIRGMSSMALPIGSWQPLGFAKEVGDDLEQLQNIVAWIGKFPTLYEAFNYMTQKYESITLFESYETWKSNHGISEEHYLLLKLEP